MACNRCLSWLLLTSYAILLVIGLFGLYLSCANFGYYEPLPPTPPPSNTTESDTTTTTQRPYGYNNNYYHSRNNEAPEAYKKYAQATWQYARVNNDPRLYVLLPSVSSIVVAALVLVCGLYSRQFFCYTYSLYSSISIWVLTFTWTLIYQTKVAWNSDEELVNVGWIIGTHCVLLLLLFVQIMLCVCELRQKKADWPTFNLTSLFTADAVLVTARLTLTVYSFIFMSDAQIFRGFTGKNDPHYSGYDIYSTELGIRYPRVLTLAFCSAVCYNAVAILETTLSMLLGRLHSCMTTTTTLLSALCCIAASIICSPVVVRMQLTPRYIYTETFYICVGLSVATLLHLVTCTVLPVASRKPPQFLADFSRKAVAAVKSYGGISVNENPWSIGIPQVKPTSHMTTNLISAIFSIFSIIIIVAVWDSPLYRAWGSALVLCANSATLVRTLPAVIVEIRYKQRENIPLYQRVIAMSLECAALLVGAITIFARCFYGGEIFGGVINIVFCIFQVYIIVDMMKETIVMSLSKKTEQLTRLTEESSGSRNNEENPTEVLT